MKKKGIKKSNILKAATELFSIKGVRNTTMDEIAKRAGIGKGTIYYYYNDKQEILRECYMNHIHKIRKNKLDGEGEGVVSKLQKVLQFIREETHSDPFVSTLFQEYQQYRSPEIERCFKLSEENAVEVISLIIEEGRENGELARVPLPLTAFLLVRMMFAYNLDYQRTEQTEDEFLQILHNMLVKK
ncbi:TetR/AcrR family transcriptional regulator [Salibacterium aidingense]|uniref:TetR/AcrR family transcriptional regulator n=1 Tax=Salibacterium aidingense TaxID=384933 RepID=UPI000401497D